MTTTDNDDTGTSTTSRPPTRWRLAVPALWWAGILGLSSIPQSSFDPLGLPAWTSVLAHVVEYGVLGAALRWALPTTIRRPVLVTVLVGVALGGLDELWQSTVPGRHPSPADLVVDVVALTVAAQLVHRWLGTRRGTRVLVDR